MAVELFQEPIRRRYYAPYLSCSYLFFLLSVWVLVALPFFLSFDSTFWLKTSTYREQPAVSYSYKTLLTASGADTYLTHSSVPSVNSVQSDTYRACTVKSRAVDSNLDTLADELKIEVTVPLVDGEEITKVDMVVFLHLQLRSRAKIVMESALHFSYDSGQAGSEFLTIGTATFKQADAVPVRGGYTEVYTSADALDPDNVASIEDAAISTILTELGSRNLTVAYTKEYEYWTPATSATDSFVLTASVKIPKSTILYIPTATEVLRDAWTKYLAMFIVVGFFMEKLCSFIYFHQIVETKMLVETVGSQVGVPHFKKF